MTAAAVARAKADMLRQVVATYRSPSPAPRPAQRPPIAAILRGEWLEAPSGPVFVRDEWFPLDHEQGAVTLGAALQASGGGLRALLGADDAVPPEHYGFFDIETTGLTGGAGMYIVLAGLGTYERAAAGEPLAFRLRQYFLAGPEHERAMLELLADDMRRCAALVTYNGKSFDVPAVETRCTLARVTSPCRAAPHIDLLHAVRRLYKHRLPGCRLPDAERRLLRMERADDLPGYLVPQLYRDYLMAGRAAPLRGVFRHNAEDVLSLAGLLSWIATLLAHDDHDPDDQAALARWWERTGDAARALALYERALPWLEGGGDWAWAAHRAARLRRRAGDREGAAALWRALWSAGDVTAGLELAKHQEHHLRDIKGAADTVEGLLSLRGEADATRDALAHRAGRLARKISKASSRSRDSAVLAAP